MALQDILKKVLADAAKKVSLIELEEKAEIADIQKQIKTSESEALADLGNQHAETMSLIEAEAISSARREQKKFQLSAKCSILESSLDAFYNHLLEVSDADYEKIITALFAKISESGTVLVPKKRLEITKKAAPKNMVVESTDEIAGGFILKTDAMSIDNSFKNVVYSEFKTEIEGFFARKLELI